MSQIGDDRGRGMLILLSACKTKPEARREGEESILVADNGTFLVIQMSRG